MKKRNFILTILLSIMSVVGFKFYQQSFAFADTTESKSYNYQVTQSDNTYTIIGNYVGNTSTYIVSENNTSLSNAITLIAEDLQDFSYTPIVTFNNISLNENLIINIKAIELKGTINLGNFAIINNSQSSSNFNILNFNDLTLNSTSENEFITINGSKTKLTVNNTKFLSSSNSKPNYAIHLSQNSHALIFSGSLQYDSNNLYNHETGITATANDISLISNSKIKITIPFHEDGKTIITSNKGESLFEFVPLSSNYTCSIFYQNQILSSKIEFPILFNANGGTFTENDTTQISSRYKYSSTYPTPTKLHSTFIGYVGKIIKEGTTYYFDQEQFSNYLNGSSQNLSFETYFSKTLPQTTSEKTFKSYNYQTSSSSIECKAVKFMLENEMIPEFIAIWEDTVYTISFVTNCDETIAPISGIFDSLVSNFPTNPTKYGYTFIGWYTSETFDGDLKDSSNYEKMPGENITLYAKWQVNSNKLTVFPNNNETLIEQDINFGEPLAEILNELSSNLTYSGYEFIGWFSDNELETPFEITTMPNSPLSVYAKWQKASFKITLYKNFKDTTTILHEETKLFEESLVAIKDMVNSKLTSSEFNGYRFRGWFKDSVGESSATIPSIMPAEDVVLYAGWSINYYNLELYYFINQTTPNESKKYYYNQAITLPSTLNISNYIFDGWYLDTNFTQSFNYNNMPNKNLKVYAKLNEKTALVLDETPQTYTLDSNNGFVLSLKITGFKVEYLVDGQWTITAPTQKGSYDIKITRNEDSYYKAYSKTIENGLTITANEISLQLTSTILYCVAGFEILFAIIVLFLRKQRKTYLTFAIALPFGIVTNTDFANFMVALTLAIFGFILLIIQLTKLRQVNTEIAKISTDQEKEAPKDISANESVERNVEILLREKGFISAKDEIDDETDKELKEAFKQREKLLKKQSNNTEDTDKNTTNQNN